MIRKLKDDSYQDVIRVGSEEVVTPLEARTEREAREESKTIRKKSLGCSFHEQRRGIYSISSREAN